MEGRVRFLIRICSVILLAAITFGVGGAEASRLDAARENKAGNDRYTLGDYEGASENFLAAVEAAPEADLLQYNLATALCRLLVVTIFVEAILAEVDRNYGPAQL